MYIGGKDNTHNAAFSWEFWNDFTDENITNGNIKAKRGQEEVGETFSTAKGKGWDYIIKSITM